MGFKPRRRPEPEYFAAIYGKDVWGVGYSEDEALADAEQYLGPCDAPLLEQLEVVAIDGELYIEVLNKGGEGAWPGFAIPLKPLDYSQISPGVRELVRELREVHGLETTDSGDGSNHAAGMQGARRERHVAGIVPEQVCDLVAFADNLQKLYPGARVEVSYSPGEATIWDLLPDGYSDETLAELGVSREPPPTPTPEQAQRLADEGRELAAEASKQRRRRPRSEWCCLDDRPTGRLCEPCSMAHAAGMEAAARIVDEMVSGWDPSDGPGSGTLRKAVAAIRRQARGDGGES